MKANPIVLVVFIFAPLQLLFAQSPSLTWAKSVKSQVIPGNQVINNPNAVVTDAAGNVYMTGAFTGTADFDPGAATTNLSTIGNKDIFITKFDISGNFVWAKSIGGSGDDMGLSLAVDASGNVYVTGVYTGTVDFDPGPAVFNLAGSGLHNAFILKLNASGVFVWADAIIGSDAYSSSIALDASSNVYITGYYQLTVDFDPSVNTLNLNSAGGYDIFLAKYNSFGVLSWAKSFGGTNYELATGVNVDASSNVYITGYFGSTTVDFDPSIAVANLTLQGGNDVFIAKYDVSGNYIWAKDVGGATGNLNARALTTDATGNVYISGIFTGTADFDPSVATANLTNLSSTDVFFAKYTSAGAYVWAKSIAGSGPDECYSIAVDATNNVYITGYIGGSADFDPSAATANLFPSGFDIYMAKYDVNGNYLWAKDFGSSSNSNLGYAVSIDASGYLYLAGTFTGTIDFDPTSGVTTLSTNPVGVLYNADIFVAKYTTGSTLPIVVGSFDAKLNGSVVTLQWTTINEQQNENFIVERSDDALRFYAVTNLAGKANGQIQNNYKTYDTKPINGIAYYRLKETTADGKYSFSKVVAVKANALVLVTVYPNPASNILHVSCSSLAYQKLLLLNSEGKIMMTQNITSNDMQLNISTLAAGKYFIWLMGVDGPVNKSFVKN